MLNFRIIRQETDFAPTTSRPVIIDFLYKHLGPYTDTKAAIDKAIDYAFSGDPGRGGFLLTAYSEGDLAGALVMNRTGMEGFVPENLLVYVAVDSKFRNHGYGRMIVDKAIETCTGDVALHCDFGNPAQRLYERMGFEVKYNEMRYYKKHTNNE